MKPFTIYYGRYTLEEKIATGGFAEVYRASEVERTEKVVVKVCTKTNDTSANGSLAQEAELIRKFKNDHIVKLYPIRRPDKSDIFHSTAIELNGNPTFFVMEYLQGGTLEEYLQHVDYLTPAETIAIALPIARALDYIHLRTYAHNDLKLENIVFRHPVRAGEKFTPVLVDFNTATCKTLPLGGSWYSMPPEQVVAVDMQQAPELLHSIDRQKVDVWGLGILLYRMLGGRLPFGGRTTRTLTDQIKHTQPHPLSSLSPHVSTQLSDLIINGCLAKNPAERLSLVTLGQKLVSMNSSATVALKNGKVKK